MIEEFPKMKMNEGTVDWLTEWVKQLSETDEVNAKKLDSFIKSMDGMMDRLNTVSLYAVVMSNANAAGHELIMHMHEKFVLGHEPAEETPELKVLLDSLNNYALAQKTVANVEDAFFDDNEDQASGSDSDEVVTE
jgi:hypothetical protein